MYAITVTFDERLVDLMSAQTIEEINDIARGYVSGAVDAGHRAIGTPEMGYVIKIDDCPNPNCPSDDGHVLIISEPIIGIGEVIRVLSQYGYNPAEAFISDDGSIGEMIRVLVEWYVDSDPTDAVEEGEK